MTPTHETIHKSKIPQEIQKVLDIKRISDTSFFSSTTYFLDSLEAGLLFTLVNKNRYTDNTYSIFLLKDGILKPFNHYYNWLGVKMNHKKELVAKSSFYLHRKALYQVAKLKTGRVEESTMIEVARYLSGQAVTIF